MRCRDCRYWEYDGPLPDYGGLGVCTIQLPPGTVRTNPNPVGFWNGQGTWDHEGCHLGQPKEESHGD